MGCYILSMAEAEAINKSQRVNCQYRQPPILFNHDTSNLTDITVAIYKIFLELFLLGKGTFCYQRPPKDLFPPFFFEKKNPYFFEKKKKLNLIEIDSLSTFSGFLNR